MQIVHMYSGDTLPQTQVENTIYVLHTGTYLLSTYSKFKYCNAVVGDGEVIVQPTAALSYMFDMDNVTISNNILADLEIDGRVPNSTSFAQRALRIYTADNSTVSDVVAHDTSSYIIDIYGSSTNMASNHAVIDSKIFGSQYGVRIYTYTEGSVIDNIKTYNCTQDGITAYSDSIIINNVHTFNNGRAGIYLFEGDVFGIVNNVIAHNNGWRGIYITAGANTRNLSNILSYNHNLEGIYSSSNTNYNNLTIINNDDYGMRQTSYDGIYYGAVNIDSTHTSLYAVQAPAELIAGTDGLY